MSDLSTLGRKIKAGVILPKGITELLDVAPFEAFAHLNENTVRMLGLPEEMLADTVDIELIWVTEDGGPAPLAAGAMIQPTHSFKSSPTLDIVLMGAYDPARYKLSEGERDFIRKSYENCLAFLTICGGYVPLLELGLLGGKTVACPRPMVKMMKQMAPHVNWVEKRWAHDGKLWSSGALLNGTDMMREFMIQTWGGRKGMVEAGIDIGGWPQRDVDYKDHTGYNNYVEHMQGLNA